MWTSWLVFRGGSSCSEGALLSCAKFNRFRPSVASPIAELGTLSVLLCRDRGFIVELTSRP